MNDRGVSDTGFSVKTRNKRFFFVVTAILLFSVLLRQFIPETLALAWHIRHGAKVVVGNYEVPVPLLWWGPTDESSLTASFSHVQRKVWNTNSRRRVWGMMAFSLAPLPTTGAEQLRSMSQLDKRLGTRTKVAANLVIADQATICLQIEQSSDLVEIHCFPESEKRGFSASYLGSDEYVELFFATLRDVKRGSNVR